MQIVQKIEISAAPSRVWKYLTNTKLMAEWLPPPTDFKAEVGARFTFRSECEGKFSTIKCEIVRLEPERCIAFLWVDEAINLDSVVTIRLYPRKNTTIVELTQSGWHHREVLFDQHKNTWREILENLGGIFDLQS